MVVVGAAVVVVVFVDGGGDIFIDGDIVLVVGDNGKLRCFGFHWPYQSLIAAYTSFLT